MNKIKRAVENYRQSKDIQLQNLAAEMFPDLTEKRSREKLSKLLHADSLDSLKIKDAVAISNHLGITINELLSDYENT